MLAVLEPLEDAMNTEQTSMKKNRWVLIVPAAIAVIGHQRSDTHSVYGGIQLCH